MLLKKLPLPFAISGKVYKFARDERNDFYIYDVNANATLSCILSFVFDSQTEFFHGRFPKINNIISCWGNRFGGRLIFVTSRLCRYFMC